MIEAIERPLQQIQFEAVQVLEDISSYDIDTIGLNSPLMRRPRPFTPWTFPEQPKKPQNYTTN